MLSCMHSTACRAPKKFAMATITPTELQKLLASQPNVLLIDVRTPAEFSQVHVPQARNLPLGQFHAADVGVARDQPVYILCHSGGRAGKAADQLKSEGLEQAIVVEGGTQAWLDAGLAVERGRVESDQPRTPGPHCRGVARFHRGAARAFRECLVLHPARLRRRGPRLRRHHGFLRHGAAHRETAVEYARRVGAPFHSQ